MTGHHRPECEEMACEFCEEVETCPDAVPATGDALDIVEPAVAAHPCTDCPVRREVVRLWDAVALLYAAMFPESEARPETTDWA